MEPQHNKHTRFPFYVPSPGERGQADKCPLFSLIPYQFFIFHSRSLFSLFFLTCVYLSIYLLMYCFSGFISSLRIQSKNNSVQNSRYVKNIHTEESTKICLEIIIRVFYHTVQRINEKRLTNIFKNLCQNNKDFFFKRRMEIDFAIFEFEKHNSFFS